MGNDAPQLIQLKSFFSPCWLHLCRLKLALEKYWRPQQTYGAAFLCLFSCSHNELLRASCFPQIRQRHALLSEKLYIYIYNYFLIIVIRFLAF